MAYVLVTAVCNQPETCASDVGDDQSRCLCKFVEFEFLIIGIKTVKYGTCFRRRVKDPSTAAPLCNLHQYNVL